MISSEGPADCQPSNSAAGGQTPRSLNLGARADGPSGLNSWNVQRDGVLPSSGIIDTPGRTAGDTEASRAAWLSSRCRRLLLFALQPTSRRPERVTQTHGTRRHHDEAERGPRP